MLGGNSAGGRSPVFGTRHQIASGSPELVNRVAMVEFGSRSSGRSLIRWNLSSRICTREDYVGRALEMVINTCPFDASGHPGMNVPCGLAEDLPVGLMLIGRRYEEATVLRAAAAFEELGTWTEM
jgi:hypothetical protein